MHTVFDWLTVAAFAGFAVLLLQRSVQDVPSDRLWQYAPPAVGCMVSNWLGNHDYTVAALIVLASAITYVLVVLRPFRRDA